MVSAGSQLSGDIAQYELKLAGADTSICSKGEARFSLLNNDGAPICSKALRRALDPRGFAARAGRTFPLFHCMALARLRPHPSFASRANLVP